MQNLPPQNLPVHSYIQKHHTNPRPISSIPRGIPTLARTFFSRFRIVTFLFSHRVRKHSLKAYAQHHIFFAYGLLVSPKSIRIRALLNVLDVATHAEAFIACGYMQHSDDCNPMPAHLRKRRHKRRIWV